MVILNFTVPFALEAIPKGLKTRTMRPVRENPNSVWNRLYQKWNRTGISIEDYCSNNPNPTYIHKKIELQLWWQQRSRFYHCEHCGTKILFKQEHKKIWEQRKKEEIWNQILTMNEFKCKNCQGIMWEKEAHKLADAILTKMTKRTLGSLTEEEWEADGFHSHHNTEDEPYHVSARLIGLDWFGQTYNIQKDLEETGIPCQQLLDLEVYIIEWRLI